MAGLAPRGLSPQSWCAPRDAKKSFSNFAAKHTVLGIGPRLKLPRLLISPGWEMPNTLKKKIFMEFAGENALLRRRSLLWIAWRYAPPPVVTDRAAKGDAWRVRVGMPARSPLCSWVASPIPSQLLVLPSQTLPSP